MNLVSRHKYQDENQVIFLQTNTHDTQRRGVSSIKTKVSR